MSTDDADRLAMQLRSRFEQSVDSLDAGTCSRLNRARQHALAAPRRPAPFLWLPAGALAAVCAAVVLTFSGNHPGEPAHDPTFIDEIDIISELDLYENLDFYEWLEQHELPS